MQRRVLVYREDSGLSPESTAALAFHLPLSHSLSVHLLLNERKIYIYEIWRRG